LRHLRVFVALVDVGSMTAAAQRLGVAQSTVSESLAGLERTLGTPAMTRHRGAHAIEPTPAGLALLPHARSVLANLEDARVAVASVARDMRGRVELIANESVTTYLLPGALSLLRQKWPNLRFAVTVGMCQRIQEGLAGGQYDVGLMLQVSPQGCVEPEEAPAGSEGRLRLAKVPLVVFAGAQHPLVVKSNDTPWPREQLTSYPIFVSDSQGYFYMALRDFFHPDGVEGLPLQPTGSVEAVKRSVLATPLGLGVLPKYAIADELDARLVRAIAVRPALPSLHLEAMLYRTRPPMHPAIAELIDVLTLVGSPTRVE
jgi:DNA-binding transcriptional LysR family regulator